MIHRNGHTLVETLVVVAIIGILMAMATPHYIRAIRMAKQVAGDEAKRQDKLVTEDYVQEPARNGQIRDQARASFRRSISAGNFDIYVSEMLCGVTNDAEFSAYWHTLLNPANSGPIEFSGDTLLAKDEAGSTFSLPILSPRIIAGSNARYPLSWDFISTNMAYMSIGNLGTSVVYDSGERTYIKYPGGFPATPRVAELSQRFAEAFAAP